MDPPAGINSVDEYNASSAYEAELNWNAAIEPGLPTYGDAPAHLHAEVATPWAEGVVVRFSNPEGATSIVNVHRGHGYRTALWRWEATSSFILVAGGDAFWVRPDSPKDWRFLTHLATSCVFSDDGAQAFIATYTDVVAIDRDGVRQWTRRLAIDGVEVARILDGVLVGRACMDPPDDWREFRVLTADGSDAEPRVAADRAAPGR